MVASRNCSATHRDTIHPKQIDIQHYRLRRFIQNPGDRRVTTPLDCDFKTFRRQEVPDCGLQCQSPWYLHLCSHLGICTSHIWYHQISQPRSRAIYRWIWIFDVNLHDLLNNFAFQERQPLISTLMRICQQMLIEPHLMQDGGVQVTKVTGTFYRT